MTKSLTSLAVVSTQYWINLHETMEQVQTSLRNDICVWHTISKQAFITQAHINKIKWIKSKGQAQHGHHKMHHGNSL